MLMHSHILSCRINTNLLIHEQTNTTHEVPSHCFIPSFLVLFPCSLVLLLFRPFNLESVHSNTLTMPSVLVIVRPSTSGKKRIEEIRDWLLNQVKTNEPWISAYESWWTPSVEVKDETDLLILFKSVSPFLKTTCWLYVLWQCGSAVLHQWKCIREEL
jgi:hypothetical protein